MKRGPGRPKGAMTRATLHEWMVKCNIGDRREVGCKGSLSTIRSRGYADLEGRAFETHQFWRVPFRAGRGPEIIVFVERTK